MDGMLLYTLVAIASVLAAQQPTGFIGGGAGFGVQGGFGEESLPASEPSSRPDSSYDRDSRYRAGSGNPGATPAQPQPESPKKLPPSGLKFDPMTTVEMRGDARLCEVVFVDAECGWAVGDRGVIWHTEDGGRRWQLQESGIGASLRSVTFIDRQTGWVGGGSTHPYAHSSFAVVLATRDGGRSWKQVPAPLPAVRRLRMFDTRRGWALCAPSSRFPWPVFVTEDGGQTWAPLVGGAQGDWLAAELTAPASGALAGRMGAAAAIRQQRVELLGAAFGLRALRDLRLLPPTGGWLVGDGGLLMATTDLGASWQSPPAPLPQEFADQFDLRTVTAVGDRVWAAGDPGTRVLHSPDGGRSWLAATTNSRAPIEDLCFVDTLHGWAVGALGTILATDDGGRTWRRQRCGGTRAALLGVYAEAEQVPLELIARLSGNEGYLAAVATLCRRDVETPPRGTIHLEERLQEAVVHSGGSESSIAWRFPLRQSGLTLSTEQILDTWNRATDGRGIAELRAYLVARIRLWRPEIVFTHDLSPSGDDPLGHLINQMVLQAVRDAADPTMFPQQITVAGLEPWQVQKVYVPCDRASREHVVIESSQFAPRLGRSLEEVTAEPRGLIVADYRPADPQRAFRLLSGRASSGPESHDFFAGFALQPGGDARRSAAAFPAEDPGITRRIAIHRRNMRAILDRVDQGPQSGVQLLGQANDLVRGLDAESAGYMLFRLGDEYRRSGRWALAAECFARLVEDYPAHPLCRSAIRWLVQYYASAEAAVRLSADASGGVVPASAPVMDPAQVGRRAERALGYGQQLEASFPEVFAEPSVRISLATALRVRGEPRQAERYLAFEGGAGAAGEFLACAQAERWLQQFEGLPPKPLLTCVRTPAKPRLDGRLDDEAWQRAKAVTLSSPLGDDAEWPAAAMLAYDDEYLYVAVRCGKAPTARYDAAVGPRPRDPDLAAFDRVELLLDIDRDYATYYRLAMDYRGWTGEDCWDDRSWNPTWFVAAEVDDRTWNVEAAIPFDQLAERSPRPREIWTLELKRLIPGSGIQSWNQPATAEPRPENSGLLLFD